MASVSSNRGRPKKTWEIVEKDCQTSPLCNVGAVQKADLG